MWRRIKQTGLVAILTLALGLGIGLSVAGPLTTVQGQNAASSLQIQNAASSVQLQNVTDGEPELLHAIYAKANPSVVSIDVRLPQTAGNSGQFNLPGQGQ